MIKVEKMTESDLLAVATSCWTSLNENVALRRHYKLDASLNFDDLDSLP